MFSCPKCQTALKYVSRLAEVECSRCQFKCDLAYSEMKEENRLCYICDQPISEDAHAFLHSYWTPMRWLCHAACKDQYKSDVITCQEIDADCNDCAFFKREKLIETPLAKSAWLGTCTKFNKPTHAFPSMSTGRICFEHRRKKKDD